MALPNDIANSAPPPLGYWKVATHGPYYVTLWPQIAALGPRACGSTALWQQFAALW